MVLVVSSIVTAILLVVLASVLARLPAAACCGHWSDRPSTETGLHWKEWHHGYMVVAIPPLILLGLAIDHWIAWVAIGAVIAFLLYAWKDDLGQHLIQLRDPDRRFYTSPLKRWAERHWYSKKEHP